MRFYSFCMQFMEKYWEIMIACRVNPSMLTSANEAGVLKECNEMDCQSHVIMCPSGCTRKCLLCHFSYFTKLTWSLVTLFMFFIFQKNEPKKIAFCYIRFLYFISNQEEKSKCMKKGEKKKISWKRRKRSCVKRGTR